MKLVKFPFAKIFGENAEEWIKIVEDGLRELFIEYSMQMFLTETNGDEGDDIMIKKTFLEGSIDCSLFVDGDEFSDYEFYISDFTGNPQFKSELDEYLEEPLLTRVEEFDILSWWRVNGLKYPTLSRIASDILSLPVSTLSADSIFDMQIRKMDSYRSSLSSLTLEALICAKDWFQSE